METKEAKKTLPRIKTQLCPDHEWCSTGCPQMVFAPDYGCRLFGVCRLRVVFKEPMRCAECLKLPPTTQKALQKTH